MGEYWKALSYYEKGFEIRQKILPENHPDLAITYNNMGMMCHSNKECAKTLSLLYLKSTDESFNRN
jgi:hypothetical protein